VLFGALKRKSCLSVASSFSLAEKSAGVGKKMQTANFLFVSFFFCSGKRKMKNHPQNQRKEEKKPLFHLFPKKNPENIWKFQKNPLPLHSLSKRK